MNERTLISEDGDVDQSVSPHGWKQNSFVCACVSPDNLGTISENLHVDVAGPVGMSHDVDLIEFSLLHFDVVIPVNFLPPEQLHPGKKKRKKDSIVMTTRTWDVN